MAHVCWVIDLRDEEDNHHLHVYEVQVEGNKFALCVVTYSLECYGIRGYNAIDIVECCDIRIQCHGIES